MIIHSINTIAMELIHNTQFHQNKVPNLRDICMEQIATGFGNNDNERDKNKIQNLATLYKAHKKGNFKQYPYAIGSDEIKNIESKIFPDHNPEYIQAYAKKVYQNVSTPFLVKHDNDSFYIQDDRTNIALFNIKTGEKHTVFKGTSFIRCCAKNKSNDHLYIGTSDGKVYALKTDINHCTNTHKEEIFSPEYPNNSPIMCLAADENYVSCSRMGNYAYLIDLKKNTWIHEDYQYRLSAKKKRQAISKAVNEYRLNFFYPRINRKELDYKIPIKGNDEWIYNKILVPLNLIDEEDTIVSDPYPYTLWENGDFVCSLAMHNNITYTGTNRGDINLLDIRSGEIIDLLKRHNGHISCLITSQHNNYIFYSGGSDGFIKQHDLRNLAQFRKTIEPQKNGVTCIYESHDGKTIYSGGPSNGIRMYDFTTGRYDHYKNQKIRLAHALINDEIKKVSLQYVDCISANDDESELYISNIPTGITVLSPYYGLEEFADDIKVAEQSEK